MCTCLNYMYLPLIYFIELLYITTEVQENGSEDLPLPKLYYYDFSYILNQENDQVVFIMYTVCNILRNKFKRQKNIQTKENGGNFDDLKTSIIHSWPEEQNVNMTSSMSKLEMSLCSKAKQILVVINNSIETV